MSRLLTLASVLVLVACGKFIEVDQGTVASSSTVDGGADSSSNDADSASASDSPNIVPGQCVLINGVWYCGAPYGNLRACPSNTAARASCTFDGGTCFVCSLGAGETYECIEDGWGMGLPTQTGCSL